MENNNLEGMVVGLLQDIREGIIDIAPEALDLALLAVQVDSVASLKDGAFYALVGWLIYKAGVKIGDKYGNDKDCHAMPTVVPKVIAGVIGGLFGFIGVKTLISVWYWTGVFAPELWLAHEAVTKVL